jgi:streptomycin 6-kinase
MIREGGDDAAARIAHGFWLVLARPPSDAERALLMATLERFRAQYAAAPTDAAALLAVGDAPRDAAFEPAAAARDLAAFTLIASILLCRDEAVMRN